MKILRCPKCKSDKINFYSASITGAYFCEKCGYLGPLVIEEDVEENTKVCVEDS